MQHFPIFVNLAGQRVVVSGGGEAALAKLRLLFKTEAALVGYAADPAGEIVQWAEAGRLTLVLARRIGEAFVVRDVDGERVRAFLRDAGAV